MEAVKLNDPSKDNEDGACKVKEQNNSDLLKGKSKENGLDVVETVKGTDKIEDIVVERKLSKGYGFCKV